MGVLAFCRMVLCDLYNVMHRSCFIAVSDMIDEKTSPPPKKKKKKQWILHNCGNTTEATTLQKFFKKKKKRKTGGGGGGGGGEVGPERNSCFSSARVYFVRRTVCERHPMDYQSRDWNCCVHRNRNLFEIDIRFFFSVSQKKKKLKKKQ